jgi:hypothetical protein
LDHDFRGGSGEGLWFTRIANHPDMTVAAALQGLGIAYIYDDDRVADALERGEPKRVSGR